MFFITEPCDERTLRTIDGLRHCRSKRLPGVWLTLVYLTGAFIILWANFFFHIFVTVRQVFPDQFLLPISNSNKYTKWCWHLKKLFCVTCMLDNSQEHCRASKFVFHSLDAYLLQFVYLFTCYTFLNNLCGTDKKPYSPVKFKLCISYKPWMTQLMNISAKYWFRSRKSFS